MWRACWRISDGFRGQVTSVIASDPTATKEPFTVEYELSQPKFVDWSKKPVRIPALLPQIGLPEPPTKLTEDGKPSNIELGTPLNVETQLTLHLPPAPRCRPQPALLSSAIMLLMFLNILSQLQHSRLRGTSTSCCAKSPPSARSTTTRFCTLCRTIRHNILFTLVPADRFGQGSQT